MDWHSTDCKRPDIVDFGNGRSCLACGSIEPRSILPPIRQQSEIRILRLQHGAFDDPIVCEVCTKDLAYHPEYEAVSYTWADESGDATRSRTIQIRDKPYQSYGDDVGNGNVYDFHQGMFEFVSRRYFSRAWIMQEVALARQATVICGSISVPWTLVKSGEIASLVRSGLYADSARQSIPPCFAFDHSLYSTPGQELRLLDFAARNCIATDPRDKIFSLLGVIPGGRLGTIEADYSLTASQLYAKTAHYLASQHGWMSVLCRAGVENAFLTEIPSWAPDWTRPLRKDPAMLKGLPMQSFEKGGHGSRGNGRLGSSSTKNIL
ncbi:HET-domain-containing protein [Apiospora aurea]|uniref:HET-domain-containing protein n=1 Tax=Apiospora aurea TaxID=335848 RepID=A0ABR1QUU3_9PEZI